MALSSHLVFDMLEDLPMTNIDVEHTQLSMQPNSAIVAMVVGGDHPPSMDSQECTSKVNVVV